MLRLAATATRALHPAAARAYAAAATSSRDASTLVFADHDNGTLVPSTLNCINAAKAIGGDITVLVAGDSAADVVAQVAKVVGVTRVLNADNAALKGLVAESVTPVILAAHKQFTFTHIIASATSNGKNILPRVAAKLDVSLLSDVTGIKSEDTFVRNVYAGNAIQTVKSGESVKVVTVRGTAFGPVEDMSGNAAVETFDAACSAQAMSSFLGQQVSQSDKPSLASAKRVVSGGRGVKGAENWHVIEELADAFDAAVGASRAAVDANFCSNELQVGQTGKIVAPELYVAVGISGAIQHMAGMKDSKVIVAINKNKEEPIFQVADYGLEADLFKAVPDLISELQK